MKLRTKIYFRLKNYPYNMTNERMVEIPFIIQNLPQDKSFVILDIGCDESILPVMLCSYGYNVHGIDINNYNFKHGNFFFNKINLKDIPITSQEYDIKSIGSYNVIISMSTIEHIGLGYYGEDNLQQDEAFKKIHELLSDDGIFILTLPYGLYSIDKLQIVYDEKLLKEYTKEFNIIKEEYFRSYFGSWMPCEKKELKDISSNEGTYGVACLVMMKDAKRVIDNGQKI